MHTLNLNLLVCNNLTGGCIDVIKEQSFNHPQAFMMGLFPSLSLLRRAGNMGLDRHLFTIYDFF